MADLKPPLIYGPEPPFQTSIASDTIRGIQPGSLHLEMLEFAKAHPPPEFPPYSLELKIGNAYRLIRDLLHPYHEGTRVVITRMRTHVLMVRALQEAGGADQVDPNFEEIFVPRIPFDAIVPSGHMMTRKQFPLVPDGMPYVGSRLEGQPMCKKCDFTRIRSVT